MNNEHLKFIRQLLHKIHTIQCYSCSNFKKEFLLSLHQLQHFYVAYNLFHALQFSLGKGIVLTNTIELKH